MIGRGFAPAKINLYLHVGPPGPDGYHPLESWMVFADVGDQLRIDPADQMAFAVEGPFAGEVPTGADNLAVMARGLVLADRPRDPFRLTLTKALPPASGMGGGSSDAAAVLRLLDDPSPRKALLLGADVPACLEARSLIARGRGEQLSAAPIIPALPAVLVNPRVQVSTGEVFELYDRAPRPLDSPTLPQVFESVDALAWSLEAARNDLQAPAVSLQPVIGEVLSALRGEGVLLSRMSGSGATCFALCETAEIADALAERIAHDHPGWWTVGTTLS